MDLDVKNIDSKNINPKIINVWQKHDKSITCPIDPRLTVEIETYTANNRHFIAGDINWLAVKFYRVVPAKK